MKDQPFKQYLKIRKEKKALSAGIFRLDPPVATAPTPTLPPTLPKHSPEPVRHATSVQIPSGSVALIVLYAAQREIHPFKVLVYVSNMFPSVGL